MLIVVLLLDAQVLRANISSLIKRNHIKNPSQQINIYSQYFLDRPYNFEPLGEGKSGRYSQKPLYRFDQFSCQTYVETVIALSKSSSFSAFKKNLRLIRYKNGKVGFVTRNHFPSLSWVPNNLKNGFIKDINVQVAGRRNVKTAKGKIELRQWYRQLTDERIHLSKSSRQLNKARINELNNYAKQVRNKRASIQYIPKQKLYEIHGGHLYPNNQLLNKIPSGTVILFIRRNWPYRKDYGTYMLVSHMGLIIRKNKRLYLRMSRSVEGKKVQQIAFNEYFNVYYYDPTFIGVSLYRVN